MQNYRQKKLRRYSLRLVPASLKMWKIKCLAMIDSAAPSPLGEGDGG